MRFSRQSLVLAVGIMMSALAGCRSEDEIKVETVTHEDRQAMRLRVAILRGEDVYWFIRVDGPEAQVNENQPALDAFVRSIRITEKKDAPITWTEPKTWKKGPASAERYATFFIPADPTDLEVKVTRLPAKDFSLLKNMHRWEKQVDLPLSESAEDYEKKYVSRENMAGQEVTWVTMNGLGVHALSKPAEARAAGPKDLMQLKRPGAGRSIPFKYAAPEGWVQKPPAKLALDVYEVTIGDKSAEVTLTPLGGDPAANINRWRGQVGLKEASREEIADSVKVMVVAGIKSYYVDIANPQGNPAKNRILGVIVPRNQTAWFIKMTGPLDLVGQQKNAFETFVQSFKK